MNDVTANLDKSDYPIYDDYLNFKVDGSFLDEILQEYYPGPEFKGLVPTLLSWMALYEERAVVWSRILPEENLATICPILMCPDDCDFSCSLIVAEIERKEEKVIWKKIGINKGYSIDPEKVGNDVEWLVEVPVFEFSLNNYQSMLSVFRKALEPSGVKNDH